MSVRSQLCEACGIKDLTFCSSLQGTEHDRLRQMLTHVQFDPHSTIFHEAEDADYVFNVTSGSVKLYKLLGDGRRQITGFLFPGDFPRLEKRMLGMAVDELAAAQDQMLLLGRKTAKEKVASFLLMLARRQEHRGEESDTIQVPMSRSDIADYLGLTIETVSRTLTQLRKEATITLKDNRHIEAVGIDMLEDLAEGL